MACSVPRALPAATMVDRSPVSPRALPAATMADGSPVEGKKAVPSDSGERGETGEAGDMGEACPSATAEDGGASVATDASPSAAAERGGPSDATPSAAAKEGGPSDARGVACVTSPSAAAEGPDASLSAVAEGTRADAAAGRIATVRRFAPAPEPSMSKVHPLTAAGTANNTHDKTEV